MRSIFILALLLGSQLLVQALPVHRRSDNAATTPGVAPVDNIGLDPQGLMDKINQLERWVLINELSAQRLRGKLQSAQNMAKTNPTAAQGLYDTLSVTVFGRSQAASAPSTQNFLEPRGRKHKRKLEASSSDHALASSSGTRKKKQKNIGPEHGVPSQPSTSQAPAKPPSHPMSFSNILN